MSHNPEQAQQIAPVAAAPGPPLMKSWTRDGFTGDYSVERPLAYSPDYLSATGPHVPRRALLGNFVPDDTTDPTAFPMLVADSKLGVRLLVSARTAPMPFVVRNIDADELHFIQEGEVHFETDVGVLRAKRHDFVCIPRGVGYRYAPVGGSMRSLIVESPAALEFATPYAYGTINFDRDLERARIEPATAAGGETKLILKAADGEHSVYILPHDPLAMAGHMAGVSPVWRVALAKIQRVTSLPEGGPPLPFLASKGGDVIALNMGMRPTSTYRPPVHLNADYDEILVYVDGPASWGGCTEPGTLTWVPKCVLHHGVAPFAEQDYASWLIETRATLRWTSAALAVSEQMETGTYGPQAGSPAHVR